MEKNPVVHFEMPYGDHERVAKFYAEVFGWKMNKLGQEMGDYITAETAETDEKRMVKTPGTINGGFYPGDQAPEAKCPSVVIAVGNIEESMKKIGEVGGKILGDPMDIPGIGRYVSFTDTEGNRVSILQPKNM
jgi:uncharacterized protein